MAPEKNKPSFVLTDTQKEQLQSEDSWLRGTAALDILNEAVKETGVVIPPEYVFKTVDRESVATAITSAFPLIGGMPAFTLWAAANRTEYYKMLAKLAPTETNVHSTGGVQVFTNIPQSGMPKKVMDAHGFVQTVVAQSRDADDEGDDADAVSA